MITGWITIFFQTKFLLLMMILIFRTHSNIYDGAFWDNYRKNVPLQILDWIRNTPLHFSRLKDHFLSLNTLLLDKSFDLEIQHFNWVCRIQNWGETIPVNSVHFMQELLIWFTLQPKWLVSILIWNAMDQFPLCIM